MNLALRKFVLNVDLGSHIGGLSGTARSGAFVDGRSDQFASESLSFILPMTAMTSASFISVEEKRRGEQGRDGPIEVEVEMYTVEPFEGSRLNLPLY